MKIVIANDHAGYALKDPIVRLLEQSGHEIVDLGTSSPDSVDYPDFASAAARQLSEGLAERAIVICGSGIGVSITANKIKDVRCALCMNVEMALLARLHNDANALALGARLISEDLALEIVKTFMQTDFEGGRHQRRVDKIHSLTNC